MEDDYHFKPETYLEWAREDIPAYDELQDEVARATAGVEARRILELGTGTGETARRVLEAHPEARLVGLDVNPEMLAEAHASLPAAQVETLVAQTLQDPLPAGPFDLVMSALAVHHLDSQEKRSLFARVHEALRPDGRFVLGDVVVSEQPEDAEIELSEGYDKPDTVEDQLAWLADAGFDVRVTWARKDLAVFSADFG
jgi:tRNA (cmo5U34)-methyltransferase